MDAPDQRVLILSVSAGSGHVRAAQALEEAFKQFQPGWEAVHIDVLEFAPRPLRKIYRETYLNMVNRVPELWGYLYARSDRARASKVQAKLRELYDDLNTRRLLQFIRDFRPALIITTHFLPPEVLSRQKRRKKIGCPICVVVTDFDVHRFWVHPDVELYCVASDELRHVLSSKGVARGRIAVTGIPVLPVFAHRRDRLVARSRLGLRPDVPTVLLCSGGAGVGDMVSTAKALMAAKIPLQILAVAGKNDQLRAEIERLSPPAHVRVERFGYVENMDELMDAADLAVTKSGGLTTSECLCKGLPMVIVSPIPGQEERNADYVLEHGAAVKAVNAASLEYKINYLLDHPEQLERMHRCARRLARPNAARDVIEQSLNLLPQMPIPVA